VAELRKRRPDATVQLYRALHDFPDPKFVSERDRIIEYIETVWGRGYAVREAIQLPASTQRLKVRTADGESLAGVRIPSQGGSAEGAPTLLGFGGNAWNAEAMALTLQSAQACQFNEGNIDLVAPVNGTCSGCRQLELGDACSGLQCSAPSSHGEVAPEFSDWGLSMFAKAVVRLSGSGGP
jgi:hypothetical protein